ncbi:chromosomal replication initiator protein DnaA [Stratiformator vulcanicus]|uniref:Chromosomal replication initiator protein DnaA n=1 Tax=Stratiformator vulcanicus TaxID=2527980 RepID=A0A517R4Z6_9PLAN|nr:chromosomal replication initiator protein DnaA [Stratiformator vulcanicus]QDT38942.1 Chromosomal replication initiator protein DnaA [Stratiformator vulcanicus]
MGLRAFNGGGCKMQPERSRGSASEENPTVEIENTVRAALDGTTYRNWFGDKVRFELEDDLLIVRVGSPFLVSWMQRHFSGVLRDALRESIGRPGQLRFSVDGTLRTATSQSESSGESSGAQSHSDRSNGADFSPVDSPAVAVAGKIGRRPSPPASDRSRPPRRFSDFSEFVVGECNEVAHRAASQLSADPSGAASPLFIHGGVGVGKTHLLEAVYRKVRGTANSLRVVYMTAETFGNYFGASLKKGTTPAFRQRVRTADVLILDDVDFFEGKRVFQEELLHTLQSFEQRGMTVVLAADRHPRLFTKVSDELVSRFLAGTVVRVQNPDVETRRQIIERRGLVGGKPLPVTVRDYIANRFRNNVREVEGAMNVLETYASMTTQPISLHSARRILTELERDCLRVVQVTDVERAVCDVFNVGTEELRSNRRTRSISRPRMLAMYLARKHTEAAYAEIGQHFGGRNHSTVISAEKKVGDWLTDGTSIRMSEGNLSFAEVIESIEARLQAS